MLYCNVSVHDVHYRYTTNFSKMTYSAENVSSLTGYQTISYEKSSTRITMLLATMIDVFITAENVLTPTQGMGLSSGSFASAYALQLSKTLVAMSASIFQPSDAQGVTTVSQTVGSRINIIPLLLILAIAVSYW